MPSQVEVDAEKNIPVVFAFSGVLSERRTKAKLI